MSVALVQTVVPDYRTPVFRRLDELLGGDLNLYAGDRYFDPTVETDASAGSLRLPVHNHFFGGRRLLVQTGHWRAVFGARTAILELNPRILSNWLLLLARRAAGRRTLVWGHAWPRSGRTSHSDRVRQLMRRLAREVIVYSESEATALRPELPEGQVFAAPNALYGGDYDPPTQLRPDTGPAFLFVGRLVPAKRPELLLRAFLEARRELPEGAKLYVVGDGPERSTLMRIVRLELGDDTDVVRLFGHSTDTALLSSLYSSSIASVSPGYVGLSLIQSLYHGVPMIIAGDEPHSPEIEAAVEGFNAVFFEAGSVHGLASRLIEVARAADEWAARRDEIARVCRQDYSVDAMAQRMCAAVSRSAA